FVNKFDMDKFSELRSSNVYYRFAPSGDWELGSWLLRSGLSMSAINTFLSLHLVCFSCVITISTHTELLPSGPHWKLQEICTSHPTKRLLILYWHDPLELVQFLFNNPKFQDPMELSPYRLYVSAARLHHIYTEWMLGEDAWSMQ
ncbi:hypothetical protein EDD15DRAFT_2141400, partial [Pisolithus albus]